MLVRGEYHSTKASGPFGHSGGAGRGPIDVSKMRGIVKITLMRPIRVPVIPKFF